VGNGQSISVIGTAVACPDKFRGSLSAAEAAAAMGRGLRSAGVTDVRELPLADGGEGTLDVVLAVRGGARRTTRVTGPLGDPVDAEWAMLPDGTAIVEMARASGHALVPPDRRDPLAASTRGTGELIAAALRSGARQVVVGVGGSATTDGGLGAVDALAWGLGPVPVVVACDVRTEFGDAATVFGPQKGASPAQVGLLTRRLDQLAAVYRDRTDVDVTTIEGGGAAGGLAGGLAAIGAEVAPGLDVVAELVGLDDALASADLVVTGEGKLDATSFAGKVVGGVLELALAAEVPGRAVVAGQVTGEARALAEAAGATTVLALTDRVWQGGEAFSRAALLLSEACVEIARGQPARSSPNRDR
jgi:glycerate kinase